MKGKGNPENDFNLLEIVDVRSAQAVTYDPAIFGGDLVLASCNYAIT